MTGACPWGGEQGRCVISVLIGNKSLDFVMYSCEYLHGDLCDLCCKFCLNPQDPVQQRGNS